MCTGTVRPADLRHDLRGSGTPTTGGAPHAHTGTPVRGESCTRRMTPARAWQCPRPPMHGQAPAGATAYSYAIAYVPPSQLDPGQRTAAHGRPVPSGARHTNMYMCANMCEPTHYSFIASAAHRCVYHQYTTRSTYSHACVFCPNSDDAPALPGCGATPLEC